MYHSTGKFIIKLINYHVNVDINNGINTIFLTNNIFHDNSSNEQ